MSNIDQIGDIIRFHRKVAGLTQNELAILAGVGKTAVFDVEKGKPSVRLNTLKAILNSLNIRTQFVSPLMNDWQRSRGNNQL